MRFFLYTSLLVLLSACNTKAPAILSDTVKTQEQDPFKSTMAASQFFDIDTHDDQVIEGENGTVVVFPKESIIDKNGNTFYGKVRVELTEALQLKDMLLSNLTTLSDGKLLETGGMIYLNLTIEGQQAGIHLDHPVFIEIPTANKKSGMMAYRGIRDENGNMNWVDPQQLETSLTAVDIFSLDFLPNGFQAEVERSLPFGPYTTATKALVDSLYFSLNTGVLQMEFQATELNEPFYNADKKVINGKYTDESYNTKNTHAAEGSNDRPEVSPAMIQVIQSEAYQNTLIATREFEQRLQTIFKTCSNAVLEIYVKNLDQNLWELDQKVAQYVEKSGDTATANLFYQYAEQRLTKVDHPKPHTRALNRYFSQQLKAVQKDLAATRKELITALHKKDKAVQKTVTEYKQLLWKREKYRMEKYGLEWTQTGWINIDRGTIPKTWGPQPLKVWVDNGGDFDRVYCYTVYTSLRSLYRLNSLDKTTFYVGNDQEKSMLMPEKKSAVVIAIGYKGTLRGVCLKREPIRYFPCI